MIRALVAVAALAAACGVKAPPRPPVKEGAPPAERPQAADPGSCTSCGAPPPAAPARTP